MDVKINCHSSIIINNEIYFDVYNLKEKGEAKFVFITHSHFDHFSSEDIKKIITSDTIIVCPKVMYQDVLKFNCEKFFVEQNCKCDLGDIKFETFASYNIDKTFHPKESGFVGYIVEIEGKRVAVVGDSDNTKELRNVKADILFIPVGGTYTMNVDEAVEATLVINPKLVIPTHYGSVVGESYLGEEFKAKIGKRVDCKILI